MKIFTYVLLMILVFILSKTTANAFNKSLEANALLATHWWGDRNASDHCYWYEIHCNKAGSVISIRIDYTNNLEGLGDLGALDLATFPSLERLSLEDCNLKGRIPEKIGLLSNLTYLSLRGNCLTGTLPGSLNNLIRLQYLDLSSNNISGKFHVSSNNLTRIEHLDLSNNKFTGVLPARIGSLKNLIVLDLSRNKLAGPISSSFASLIFSYGHLKILNLSMNHLIGPIPVDIINWGNLEYIDLSHNDLVGTLPPELGRLSSLVHLDLSSNWFSGNIPVFQYPCKLLHLDLSMNRFVGALDGLLSFCHDLYYLDLSSNNLVGDIPFSDISQVGHLNLSHNQFSGMFPGYLYCRGYGEVDLTSNDLRGKLTCKAHKPRNKHAYLFDIFLPIIGVFFFLVILSLMYSYVMFSLLRSVCFRLHNATRKKIHPEIKKHGDVCTILNYDGAIAYEDFIAATENFDLKYCIGTGGYGSVYEAKIPTGKAFSLKKLHRFEAEQPTFDQSFKNEVQMLTNLRHKNIVKLHGFCFHNKCNFLVYEYMEKGSLFCALGDDELAVQLDWIKRVNIIKDVARALAYMHHDCTLPIVHRDISSNNILLNMEMEGFVAYFGAARLLDHDSSNQTVIAGTLGYII